MNAFRSLLFTLGLVVLMASAYEPSAIGQQVSKNIANFQELVAALRGGRSEKDVLDQLRTAPVQVKFVLGDGQLKELQTLRVSPEFLATLRQLVEPVAGLSGDITDFVVILDCSGSMKDPLGNRSKMDVAKEAVKKLLLSIPVGRNVCFIVYGHDAKLECKAVKVVRPLSAWAATDQQQLLAFVDTLQPVGHTPIARSLRVAGQELRKNPQALSALILVTDGMETCHKDDGTPEDPVAEAGALAALVKLKQGLTVVAVGLQAVEINAVNRIAQATRGKTYDAQKPEQVDQAIEAIKQEQVKPSPPRGDPNNIAAAANGGVLVDIPAEYDGGEWAAQHLIDSPGTGAYSAPVAHPLAAVIGFRNGSQAKITAFGINPYTREDKENWVRKVRIEVSDTYPYAGFKEVGTLDVPPIADDAILKLKEPVVGRYVRFQLLQNGGGPYVQLNELMVYGSLTPDSSRPATYRNLALAKNGGKLAKYSSQYNESQWAAAHLLDGSPGRSWSGVNGESQLVVVEFAQSSLVHHLALNPYAQERIDNWVREAEFYLSRTGEATDWESVGKLNVEPIGQDQGFDLAKPVQAKFLKVVFLKNDGGSYMQANEIKAFGVSQGR